MHHIKLPLTSLSLVRYILYQWKRLWIGEVLRPISWRKNKTLNWMDVTTYYEFFFFSKVDTVLFCFLSPDMLKVHFSAWFYNSVHCSQLHRVQSWLDSISLLCSLCTFWNYCFSFVELTQQKTNSKCNIMESWMEEKMWKLDNSTMLCHTIPQTETWSKLYNFRLPRTKWQGCTISVFIIW